MSHLDGKVVIVTGAGRGVGREHAIQLAAQGARVVVNDLGASSAGSGADASPAKEVVAEIEHAGGTAVANTDDVSDWAGGERLVAQALSTFGRLDGLVNNAGILRDSTLMNLSEEDWDVSLRANLKGHVAPTRAAARHWREESKSGRAGNASVINTSSESGVFGNAGQSNYAAAKAGVAALTEVWSEELGRYGVRVNALLPRARTRLTESTLGAGQGTAATATFDKWEPANIPPFAAYLLSDACTFTGQMFLVAGGVVQRARPWSLDPEWMLKRPARWTVDELTAAIDTLGKPTNTGRDTGYVR